MTDRPLPQNAHMIPDEATQVFHGTIFDVYHWQQEMFDGTIETFEMLRRADAALVIVVDEDKIVIQDEEQPGGVIEKNRLPGGRIEPGESPLEGAKREIAEELGQEYGKWALLEVSQPAIKIEWFIYVFVATDKVREFPTAHEAGEKIHPKRVSFDEFKAAQGHHRGAILEDINSIDELLAKVRLK